MWPKSWPGSSSIPGRGPYRPALLISTSIGWPRNSLARDLAPRGVLIGLYSPGWVRTDIGGSKAPLAVEDSVRGLRQRIDELSAANSGAFLSYDGKPLPW